MNTERFTGMIVKGKGLGRTVGMPTLNLQWEPGEVVTSCPFGVYISKVRILGHVYFALTNFGYRPSVDQEERITLESFLLDYHGEGDGLGCEAEVELLHYLRPTMKMNSLEEVKKQVDLDVEQAKLWLTHCDKNHMAKVDVQNNTCFGS